MRVCLCAVDLSVPGMIISVGHINERILVTLMPNLRKGYMESVAVAVQQAIELDMMWQSNAMLALGLERHSRCSWCSMKITGTRCVNCGGPQ